METITGNGVDARTRARLGIVLLTIAVSLVGTAAAAYLGSDGRTAAWLSLVNLTFLLGYAVRWRDKTMICLLIHGAVFGVVELVADALCIRYTGTLDYTPARSPLVGLSPFWMPLAWMIVSVQIGDLGSRLIAWAGVWRGVLLAAILGAVNIPLYEEMAYHAHWWQYHNCRMWGHTPLYIIAAEAIIGGALALTARAVVTASRPRAAALLGIVGGASTIAGGIIGYGLVERIPKWLGLPF